MTSIHRLNARPFARAAIFAIFVIGGLAALITQDLSGLEVIVSLAE
ncbi:MAG: hypothetical protein LBV00_02435 [Propionibacteriaceae bacterium]|jgi:hypothetical protein|nr:hypothetical protein [Propionibacteriaceae bacterium]